MQVRFRRAQRVVSFDMRVPVAQLTTMSDKKRKLLLLLLLKKKQRLARRRTYGRRFWVHPINRTREINGLYSHLFNELRNDEARFQKYFSMTPSNYDFLLSLIRPLITKT